MRAHPGILATYINVTSRNAAKGALLTNSNDGNAGFCLGMPNAALEWQAGTVERKERIVGGLSTLGACWKARVFGAASHRIIIASAKQQFC